MTVLQLSTSSAIGGGPRHVWDLIRSFPPEIRSVILAPPGGPMLARWEASGVEVIPVQLDRLRPWTLRQVVQAINNTRPALLHTHGKGAWLYGVLAGRLTGVPILHTLHGLHWSPSSLWLARWLAQRTTALIHVSRSQAREADGLGLSGLTILNGVNPLEVRARAEATRLTRASLGIPPHAHVVGAVARADPIKRPDLVFRALFQLAGQGLEVWMVVATDDPYKAHKSGQAWGLSKHLCCLSVPDGAAILSLLDCFVSGSRKEGLPYAILDAMAWGLPVVATRVSGHIDTIFHGLTGLLTPSGDAQAFAEAIQKLLENPARGDRMGRAGHARVQAYFRLEEQVRQTLTLYHQIIAR